MTLEQAIRLVRWIARFTPGCAGRRTYFMPVGGHSATGAMGYVRAAEEIEIQLAAAGVRRATIVTAVGTGGTLAGLMAGLRLLESKHAVLGIDVGKLWKGFPASIAATASEICERLGVKQRFTASDVPMIEHTYVGDGYARTTPGCIEAIRLAAGEEGVLLDPVYSSKAMHGLIDLARQGRWARDEPVVFLHTGGLPALWAYTSELANHGIFRSG
jgi:D-cysteine desulfhydrase